MQKITSMKLFLSMMEAETKPQEELEKVYNLHETNIVIEMFSRNFGKEAAIYAGFQKTAGDLVTVIDADLQQRPEIVVKW